MPTHYQWNGMVSFGLVAIPVRLTMAVREERLAFHLLHAADGARLQRRMFCPSDGQYIDGEHIVKGFELEPDQYVVISEDEFKALAPERSRNIEIQQFVDIDAIAPPYYDRAYYLVPDKAEKAYRLLVTALADTQKAGIGKFVMHGREKLVALRSIDNALCLLTLHFAADLISGDELIPPDHAVTASELEPVRAALRAVQTKFDPASYPDIYHSRALAAIAAKQQQQGTLAAPALDTDEDDNAPGEPDTLMAALQQSLEQARQQ